MKSLAGVWNRYATGTGLPDDIFVASMIAILSLENVIDQRAASNDFEVYCNSGSPDVPFSVCVTIPGSSEAAIAVLNDRGDDAFINVGRNTSMGIANMRSQDYREILGINNESGLSSYQAPNSDLITFDGLERLGDKYNDLIALWQENTLTTRSEIVHSYLHNDTVALEFLAINLYRGLLRLSTGFDEIRLNGQIPMPNMFDLFGWHHRGVQGAQLGLQGNNTADLGRFYASNALREAWRVLEGPCRSVLPNDFFTTASNDIPYFNPDAEQYVQFNCLLGDNC
jgi:hypothetical protein